MPSGDQTQHTTTEVTTENQAAPSKLAQPHGGALNSGGPPGNRGGVGRPPSEIRRQAREIFAARLPVLEQIAEGRIVVPVRERCPSCGHEPTRIDEKEREQIIECAVRPDELVRAMEALARGMAGNIAVDDIKARLIAQVRAMRDWGAENGTAPALIERLLDPCQDCWCAP
jgi:hypothetical protein